VTSHSWGGIYSLVGITPFVQPSWRLARVTSSYSSGQRLIVVVVTGLPIACASLALVSFVPHSRL